MVAWGPGLERENFGKKMTFIFVGVVVTQVFALFKTH